MRKLSIFILALNIYVLYGQTNFNPGNDASFYFNEGVIAFRKNEINKADSLFTKSLLIKPSENALFNRAVTRFILNDTCSACFDLADAYQLFGDDSSLNLYTMHCVTSVTHLFYDKEHYRIENAFDYKYHEEIRKHKCEDVSRGTIRKKNNRLNAKIWSETYVYATYTMFDSVKFFDYIYGTNFLSDNQVKIDSYKDRLKQYLNAKYRFNEIPENSRYFIVQLLISKDGKVTGSGIIRSPFAFLDKSLRDIIEADIQSSLKLMPVLKPMKFFNEPVNSSFTITFDL